MLTQLAMARKAMAHYYRDMEPPARRITVSSSLSGLVKYVMLHFGVIPPFGSINFVKPQLYCRKARLHHRPYNIWPFPFNTKEIITWLHFYLPQSLFSILIFNIKFFFQATIELTSLYDSGTPKLGLKRLNPYQKPPLIAIQGLFQHGNVFDLKCDRSIS